MHGFRANALAVLIGLAATAAGSLPSRDAHASVSIAVTYDGLLRETSSAVIVTPAEQRSVWENGRIYTYTRVHVDRAVAGELATGADAWVRTMGGIVGQIGQHVDGEAVLTLGRPCLLFLHAGPPGALDVTARGQGQFPIVLDENKQTRIIRSSAVGALLAPRVAPPTSSKDPQAATATRVPPTLAADVLHGRAVDDVVRDVAAAFKRVHGPTK